MNSLPAFSEQADTVDPAKLPQYKVLLDNCSLQAMDYRIKPGEGEAMHSHPTGVFVYFFTDANMRVAYPDGKTGEFHAKAGEVGWRDPVTHRGENIGHDEVHALLIEPKTCK